MHVVSMFVYLCVSVDKNAHCAFHAAEDSGDIAGPCLPVFLSK